MTVERKSRKNKEKVEVEEKAVTVLPPEEPPKPEPTVLEAALAKLNTIEYNLLQAYIGAKKPELAIDMVGKCFISYLNGNDCREICKLQPGLPYEAILWAKFKYNWDRQKEEHIFNLHNAIKERVVKAQLDTTALISDMLTAASRLHGEKIKKYLQTGNATDLGDAMKIDSIGGLIKVVEGLQKITGQDNIKRIKTENTQNLNLTTQSDEDKEPISSESSEKIMQILADEKRKKN